MTLKWALAASILVHGCATFLLGQQTEIRLAPAPSVITVSLLPAAQGEATLATWAPVQTKVVETTHPDLAAANAKPATQEATAPLPATQTVTALPTIERRRAVSFQQPALPEPPEAVPMMPAAPTAEQQPEVEQPAPISQKSAAGLDPAATAKSLPDSPLIPEPPATPPQSAMMRMAGMAANLPDLPFNVANGSASDAAVRMQMAGTPGASDIMRRGSLLRVNIDSEGSVTSVAVFSYSHDALCDFVIKSYMEKRIFKLDPMPAKGTSLSFEVVADCPARPVLPAYTPQASTSLVP